MKFLDKSEFIETSTDTLKGIYDMLTGRPAIKLDDLDSRETALVIVDMINGFTREGSLMSPRIEKIITEITELQKACAVKGISKIAFADGHGAESPEFDAYPVHCMAETSESEIVAEIKEIGGYRLIQKNSTNGYLEEDFQKWLAENAGINNFIVVGDCTDICIQQFATTLKT